MKSFKSIKHHFKELVYVIITWFLCLLFLSSLTSCGVFKSTFKKKDYTKIETVTSEKGEVKVKETQNDIKINEEVNIKETEVKNPPKKDSKEVGSLGKIINDLSSGIEVLLDSGRIKVKLKLDSVNNKLNVGVETDGGSTITREINKKTSTEDNSFILDSTNVFDKFNKSILENKTKEKTSEPKNMFWLWATVIAMFGIFLFALFMFLKKKLKIL